MIPSASDTPVRRKRPNKRHAPQRLDKRRVLARGAKVLAATFRERLGLDDASDPIALASIERAAELQGLAEQARALRADATVSLDDVVRLNRLAEHALPRPHLAAGRAFC